MFPQHFLVDAKLTNFIKKCPDCTKVSKPLTPMFFINLTCRPSKFYFEEETSGSGWIKI